MWHQVLLCILRMSANVYPCLSSSDTQGELSVAEAMVDAISRGISVIRISGGAGGAGIGVRA